MAFLFVDMYTYIVWNEERKNRIKPEEILHELQLKRVLDWKACVTHIDIIGQIAVPILMQI